MRKIKYTSPIWLLAAIAALGLITNLAQASTFVSGTVSGTWAKTGSPYIATGNLIVPSGQTLTIQPGVTVTIGQGLNMDVEGAISAVGTAAERIIIQGANSSLYWDKMYINYMGGTQSSFVNCNISDATNAICLNIYNVDATLTANFLNCTFLNCQGTCVYGNSSANAGSNHGHEPNLNVLIANCSFINSSNGIHFYVSGEYSSFVHSGQGTINSTIANNLFYSLNGSAIWFEIGPVGYARNSSPIADNNLFSQCTTAVQKTGSSSSFNDEVAYNDLYNNQTNFAGYPPGVYGTICCQNALGTNCDIANNIFNNPLFAETITYTLAANSPCIDAGNPGGAYLDTKFPPSQGTMVNDIGLYGGPYAGNWQTNAWNGTTNFLLKAQIFVGVTINPSGAGQYRLDSASNVNGPWTQVTNLMLLSTPWTWIDYNSLTTSKRFFRAVLLP